MAGPATAVANSTVRVAMIPTEGGYRVRPAVALAYKGDTIRFLNLTNKAVRLELPPYVLELLGPNVIPPNQHTDVTFNSKQAGLMRKTSPCNHEQRWRFHYSVYLENGSPIPGESSPEIIIDEQP